MAQFNIEQAIKGLNAQAPYGGQITHYRIFRDDTYTMVELGGTPALNAFLTTVGFSKRDRRDTPDENLGIKLAFERALKRWVEAIKRKAAPEVLLQVKLRRHNAREARKINKVKK